ncbi:MAG: hypothetical protein IKW13_00175 [Thermoguttaceae bacterium]|nr:hypothetical protein [Thermoguttaceae bacterium]
MNRLPSDDDIVEFLADAARPSERPPLQEPLPATLPSRFEERRRWATTALAVFGVAELVAALLAGAGACWATWPPLVRAAFLVVGVAVAHCGGTLAERRDAPLLAHFLYCLGSAIFLGGVGALFVDVDAARRRELWANALPPAALLVFATAQASRSRSLHFFATAALVAGLAFDDGSRVFFGFRFANAALVCCALGEYWAWRRRSLSVATVYLGVCAWTFVALCSSVLAFDVRALASLGVFGLFLRWFGATFRSAFGATFGVFIAFSSLGLAAFPYFWGVSNGVSPSGATFGAAVAAAFFGVFSTRLIFDGARQNVVQFAIAIAVFACWLVAHTGVATFSFAENRWSLAPPTTAALAFGTLLLNLRTQPSADAPRSTPVVPWDAPTDDREFDDLFDAESRAGSQTPRLFPVLESLDAIWERVEVGGRFPAYVASVLGQTVALVAFANSCRTLF